MTSNDQPIILNHHEEQRGVLLRLFVYGTLKQGYWNHDKYCRGVLSIEKAFVYGRLYELPAGLPILQVPQSNILAYGTNDFEADLAVQLRFEQELTDKVSNDVPGKGDKRDDLTGGWGKVYGELLTFDDPNPRLSAFDYLEGYEPDSPGIYVRALVPVKANNRNVPAWLYLSEQELDNYARLLPKLKWPS